MTDTLYHIGFGKSDLGPNAPTVAVLSGDPDRATLIAETSSNPKPFPNIVA
jgi:uridine phosphorylase